MPPKRTTVAITDTQLGLAPDELETFRHHQRLAVNNVPSNVSSSRGGSTQGRFLLDPSGLQVMAGHFDRIVLGLQQRLATVR